MSFLVQTVETKVRQCGHINHASQCQSTTAVQPLKVFPSVHAVGFLHLSLHERGKARRKTSMNESVRHHHSPSIFQDGRCHQPPQTMRLLTCLLPWIPSQLGPGLLPLRHSARVRRHLQLASKQLEVVGPGGFYLSSLPGRKMGGKLEVVSLLGNLYILSNMDFFRCFIDCLPIFHLGIFPKQLLLQEKMTFEKHSDYSKPRVPQNV